MFLYGLDDLTAEPVRADPGPGRDHRGDDRAPLRGGERRRSPPARPARGAASNRRRGGGRHRARSRQHRVAAAVPSRAELRRPRPAPRAEPDGRPRPPALRRRARRGRGDRRRGRPPARRRRRPGRDRGRPPRPGAGAGRCSRRCSSRLRHPGRSGGGAARRRRHRSAERWSPCSRPSSAAARPATCCATCAAPRGLRPNTVDWLERRVRRNRMQRAPARRWSSGRNATRAAPRPRPGPRRPLAERRRCAGGRAGPHRDDDGLAPARAARSTAPGPAGATASSSAPPRRSSPPSRSSPSSAGWRPAAGGAGDAIAGLSFRAWSGPGRGPGEDRRAPTACAPRGFDHVVVGSLQDGEFPRRDGGGEPFLSDRQRTELGLEPRRDPDEEERYLFHACLALPRTRPLPLLPRQRRERRRRIRARRCSTTSARCWSPARRRTAPDPVEDASDPRARPGADRPPRRRGALGGRAGARDRGARRRPPTPRPAGGRRRPGRGRTAASAARIAAARAAEAATRAPGPLSNPAAIESLASVSAYGGTTLEEFDLCSYCWFVGARARARSRSTPTPDPLVQGRLMHTALDHLYRDRPGGDPMPRPGSLATWIERGARAGGRDRRRTGARQPPGRARDRATGRRAARRFLTEEAERDTGGFEPWLLEAEFGGRGRATSRSWRSTAGGCTARSTASTARPTGARW